jgi:DNA polymerase-3 subunit delta
MAKKASASASTSSSPAADTRMCVLHGQEEMVKRQRLDELRIALLAKHGEVETLLFDGKTASLADVLDELRSYGLMQQHKVVIVDDADVFVTQHREALERYAASPVDNGVLVLRSVKWNKGNLDKAIAKVGFVEKCDPLKPAAASSWVVKQAKEKYGRKIDPPAASLLVERLGSDLLRLDAELAKLTLMVDDKAAVTRELVMQVVGRSSEEDAWAVQEALLTSLSTGRAAPAMIKLHELVDQANQPPELVCYFVADMLRKLYGARQMLKLGESEATIGKVMKLWGPRQGVFMKVLRQIPEHRLAGWLDSIVELDVRSKTGKGDAMRNLELFANGLNTGRQSSGR